MPPVPKLSDLRPEYLKLFREAQIRPTRLTEVDQLCQRILANKSRYDAIAERLNLPWFIFGIHHSLEASLRFDKHLHNGDPLTRRTVQVPAGRPKPPLNPPFTWEQSAEDAVRLDGYLTWKEWNLAGVLYKLEGFNGWGYRWYHPSVKSPYLWSYTKQYDKGKYVADGSFSYAAVSKQVGAAAILRRQIERGDVVLAADAETFVWPAMSDPWAQFADVMYAPSIVVPKAKMLQQTLNRIPGIHLVEDGKAGNRTSDAFKLATGKYLNGDPRGA
jgi:lysozyme family protein